MRQVGEVLYKEGGRKQQKNTVIKEKKEKGREEWKYEGQRGRVGSRGRKKVEKKDGGCGKKSKQQY